jgi:hypothetical protein
MGDYDLGHGRRKALLLAGPMFVVFWEMASVPSDGGSTPMGGLGIVMLLVMIFAVPFGALLSVLPILLLTEFLAFVGYRNFGLRHPAMWGLAGGVVIAPWFAWRMESAGVQAVAIALTGTGIACALLCRSGVVWHD